MPAAAAPIVRVSAEDRRRLKAAMRPVNPVPLVADLRGVIPPPGVKGLICPACKRGAETLRLTAKRLPRCARCIGGGAKSKLERMAA